jgi:hypothetical protein
MGCLDKLPYEVIQRNSSFKEAREYVEKNIKEYYEVPPGYKIFDVYIIGVPPIKIGIDGDDVIFPYTKPCHGTFLVRVKDARGEIEKLRKK